MGFGKDGTLTRAREGTASGAHGATKLTQAPEEALEHRKWWAGLELLGPCMHYWAGNYYFKCALCLSHMALDRPLLGVHASGNSASHLGQ